MGGPKVPSPRFGCNRTVPVARSVVTIAGGWLLSTYTTARAATPEQLVHVGNQTGGRVFLFLHSDDFWRDYHDMSSRGVQFVEQPRTEAYGTVAIFVDLYGNKWDLVQLGLGSRPDG